MALARRFSSSLPQVLGLAKRSSQSLRFPDDSVDCSSCSSLTHGIHVFQCPDAVGIVAKLSECIATRGGNILAADVFVPENKHVFYSRSDFVFDPIKWPRNQMDEDFLKLSTSFNAMRSVVRVPALDPKYKIAVLASKQDHCLVDLLHGWQDGKLPVDITCVISNHDRAPNTHVIRFLERHGIPYHYLSTTKENKREGEILELVQNTDFLVLARYMQILSGNFLRSYGKDIINIHHGLLPSFKGSNPSKQAFDAGVKLIGATSHFVTEALDAGPIIEQMVERVSHRENLQGFVQKSEDLEKQCLSRAIKFYCSCHPKTGRQYQQQACHPECFREQKSKAIVAKLMQIAKDNVMLEGAKKCHGLPCLPIICVKGLHACPFAPGHPATKSLPNSTCNLDDECSSLCPSDLSTRC
ncbi:hypothetical protein L6164_019636 [Bauhinia variegata]|uniref:Uncharacterized protein n=1 Tax=Bauhinia variegata TaxID=167791 RepID=A0ACB9MUE9_BAUVA|nr:hypothetical protein L6164_019636 [Bauhinia variegata]